MESSPTLTEGRRIKRQLPERVCMYYQTLWWGKRVIYTKHICHIKQTQLACGLRRLPPVFWFEKKGETMFWTALMCHTCLQNILIGCAFITCKHARLNMAINKKTQPNSFVFSSLMVIHKKIWAVACLRYPELKKHFILITMVTSVVFIFQLPCPSIQCHYMQ